MKRKALAVLLLVLVVTIATIARGRVIQPAEDWPCAVLMYMPGNGPPGADSGLMMAVWRDGTMLFSAAECRPGKFMLVGKADVADVDVMVEAMIRAGFFGALNDDPLVPDAGYYTMALRVRSAKSRRYTGSLIPGFGKNAAPDADYWALVKMLRRCEAELHAISPHRVEQLEDRLGADGAFRGYNPQEPFKTPWLSGDAWR